MLDDLISISKHTFIETRIIPANDNDTFNDTFNDNKCTFCWGPLEAQARRLEACNATESGLESRSRLKGLIGCLCDFRLNHGHRNTYCLANLIVKALTNLPARNPDLNVRNATERYGTVLFILRILDWYRAVPSVDVYVREMISPIFLVIGFTWSAVHGKLANRRDRILFAFIILTCPLLQLMVTDCLVDKNILQGGQTGET
ncbi:hypothetical protein EK21DRAFT_88874 [Setomelanomma holmii]|uniref:Uncharacterized protein n=1 Tax=Setomelanomma holmii TaxID=210430 RepID=A0A9P4LKM9_9PLEO|nr:hypothetical protein EK21DRAFT_88874 [Setomelanomma holmii]